MNYTEKNDSNQKKERDYSSLQVAVASDKPLHVFAASVEFFAFTEKLTLIFWLLIEAQVHLYSFLQENIQIIINKEEIKYKMVFLIIL